MERYLCCLCFKECEGYGNNPDGAAWRTEDGEIEVFSGRPEDRCCDECNMKFVIPGRMYLMRKNKK